MATSVIVRCVSAVIVFTILNQIINAESYTRKISDPAQDIVDDPTFVQVSAEKTDLSDHLIIPFIVKNDLQTLQTKYENKPFDSVEYNGGDSIETQDEKQRVNFEEEKKRVIRQASSGYPLYPNLGNAPPYGQNSANTNNNYYSGYPNYNEPGRNSSLNTSGVQYRPNTYHNYSHNSQGSQKTVFSGPNYPYSSNVGQVPPYSSGNNYQQHNSSWSGYPSQNTASQRPTYYPGGNNPHYNGSHSSYPSYTNRPNQRPNDYPPYTGSQPNFQSYNTSTQRPPNSISYYNGSQPSFPSYNNPSQRPPNSIPYYNGSQPSYPSYNSQRPPYYQPTGHSMTSSGYSSYNATTPKTNYNYQPLTLPPYPSASQNPYQSHNSSVQIPPHNPHSSNGPYPQNYPSYSSGPYNGNPNTAGQQFFHYPTYNNGTNYDPRKTPPGHFSY